jgi:hypothetical protein
MQSPDDIILGHKLCDSHFISIGKVCLKPVTLWTFSYMRQSICFCPLRKKKCGIEVVEF